LQKLGGLPQAQGARGNGVCRCGHVDEIVLEAAHAKDKNKNQHREEYSVIALLRRLEDKRTTVKNYELVMATNLPSRICSAKLRGASYSILFSQRSTLQPASPVSPDSVIHKHSVARENLVNRFNKRDDKN
jgi:hypothetical protein